MVRTVLAFALIVLTTQVLGATFTEDEKLRRDRREISYKCKYTKAFEDYNNKKCCNLPVSFFDLAATKTCALKAETMSVRHFFVVKPNPVDVFYRQFVNGYKLNLLQNSDNALDSTDTTVQSMLLKPTCYAECVFGGVTDLLNADKTVNTDKLSSYLQSKVATAWKPAVEQAVTDCIAVVADKLPATVSNLSGTKTCSTSALSYMQCVNYKLIGKCPTANEPTGPADLLNKCGEAILAKDTCDIFKA